MWHVPRPQGKRLMWSLFLHKRVVTKVKVREEKAKEKSLLLPRAPEVKGKLLLGLLPESLSLRRENTRPVTLLNLAQTPWIRPHKVWPVRK